MTDREAMKLALVSLSQWGKQQKQKPFCYHDGRNIVGKEFADHSDVFPLYTAPPLRQWQGLTDEEIKALASWWPSYDQMPALMVLAKDIQNSLKERNA